MKASGWHLSQLRRNIFEKPESADERLVGITFVDVLFALVVEKISEPVAKGLNLSAAGKAQLALAFVLTVTSWIGYHNSWNRPRYFIRFINLPLAQFLLDIGLVVVYWLTAVWVEGLPLGSKEPAALPETALISVSFLFYVAWDRVAYRMRASERYDRRSLLKDVPARRRTTEICCAMSLLTLVLVCALNPDTTASVVIIDGWLIVLLLLFRLAKEAFTTPTARQEPSSSIVSAERRSSDSL